MKPRQAHVCIIDDDSAARQSLAALVESHGLPAESFASAEDFLEQCIARLDSSASEKNKQPLGNDWPDCLICDLRLSGMCGIALQKELDQRGYYIPVIIITAHGDTKTAVRAMEDGAVTYLEKPCSDDDLWSAIQQAMKQSAEWRRIAEIRRRLSMLTDSEHQVLNFALAGVTNKAMETKLGLSLRTIELRRANIMKKVGAGSFAELIRLSIEARHPWRGPHTRSPSRKDVHHGNTETRRKED